MSDSTLLLILFGSVAAIFVCFVVIPEWRAHREARKLPPPETWTLRSQRDRELDAITRGKDPRR